MPAFSPALITIMRSVLEDAMARVPAEQATTVTKAYLAEFILKAAAGGLTSYEGLITAAVAQLPTIGFHVHVMVVMAVTSPCGKLASLRNRPFAHSNCPRSSGGNSETDGRRALPFGFGRTRGSRRLGRADRSAPHIASLPSSLPVRLSVLAAPGALRTNQTLSPTMRVDCAVAHTARNSSFGYVMRKASPRATASERQCVVAASYGMAKPPTACFRTRALPIKVRLRGTISAAFVGPTSCERCPSPSSRQPNSEVPLESADRAPIRQVERIRSHRLSNHDGNRTRRSPGLEPQAGARTSLSHRQLIHPPQ